jgi:hypothetical protein
LVALPLCLSAQTGGTAPERASPDNVIWVAPWSLYLLWPGVELEHRIAADLTIGLRTDRELVEVIEGGDEEAKEEDLYTNGRVFLRYYFRQAYTGAYVHVDAGLSAVEDEEDEGTEEFTAFAAGFAGGYSWLLGERRQVAIGVGLGIDRIMKGGMRERDFLPTLRLDIGYAIGHH